MFVLTDLPASIRQVDVHVILVDDEPVLYSLSKKRLKNYLENYDNAKLDYVCGWFVDGVLHIEGEEVDVIINGRRRNADSIDELDMEKLV